MNGFRGICPERGCSGWILVWVLAVQAGLGASMLGRSSAQDKTRGQAGTGGKKESSQEALTVYGEAANFQNNGAYEIAVEEWKKFLAQFAKDPLAPKAQHYLGVCHLKLKDYPAAIAAFQAVVDKYDPFELTEEAFLNLGWCQYTQAQGGDKELFDKAAVTFSRMLKAFPAGKGNKADQAHFYHGESLYAQGQREQAADSYTSLLKDFKDSPLRRDAMYALGVTQEELGRYAQSGRVYDVYLKEFGDSPLATEVRMRKAETVLQAGLAAKADGKAEEASQLLSDAERAFAETTSVAGFISADHALYRQAYCALRQDEFARAAGLYARIPAEFPESTYVSEARLAAGRGYYKAQQMAEATTWLQQVLRADDADTPEAAHWLCRIYLTGGEASKAEELAAATLPKAAQSDYLVYLKIDQADALYESPERREEAVQLYVKIAADHADHDQAPQARYNAAFGALELKKYDAALDQVRQFLKSFGSHALAPDARFVACEAYLLTNQHEPAEKGYRELISSHADHRDLEAWRIRLGLCLYLQKKYEAVVTELSGGLAMLKQPANVAEAQYLIGASHFHQNEFEPASTAFEASIASDARWRQADEALLLLSRAQRGLNQLERAQETIRQLLRDFPGSKLLDQAHFRLGEYLYAAANYPAAVAQYDLVLKEFEGSPFAPYAIYGQGWSHLKAKDYGAGAESFTRLLAQHPDHSLAAETLLGRAMCRRQLGLLKETIDDLENFVKTGPEREPLSNARYELGLAKVGLKDFAAATSTFRQLLAEDQDYASAEQVRYELAWALKSGDKSEEALAEFRKLAAGSPTSALAAEARFHIGEHHYDMKQFQEAIASYDTAKAGAGSGELAEKVCYKLGWAQFQLEQYDLAMQQFDEQLASHSAGPLAADASFMKAECSFKKGDYQAAFPAFEAARQQTENAKQVTDLIRVLVLLHGGQSAIQLKQWDIGRQWLDEIPERYPESPYLAEALYERGRAQHKLNKLEEAAKDFEQAAAKSRSLVGASARFMAGEVYFQQKQHAKAIAQFQRVMFGYGAENAPDTIKSWQARAGYEAGRCAEVQIEGEKNAQRKSELIAESKKWYEYVVNKHPQSDLVEEAKKRLAVLAKQ